MSTILAKDAAVGDHYRTLKGTRVRVEEKNDNRITLFSCATGNAIKVSLDYVLGSDFPESSEENSKEEKERKETKTSYIDSLISKDVGIDEIVSSVQQKYPDERDARKIKRLVWSRRATLKKDGHHAKEAIVGGYADTDSTIDINVSTANTANPNE